MAMKSLKDIKAKAEARNSGGNFDGESPFLTLKDGDSYYVRFIQEFDDEAPLYDDRRGRIIVVDEHTAGPNYKVRAVCTMEDEGRCWACEQTSLPEVGKKWKPKMRFYANVIVRNEEGDDKVKIFAQGFSDKNIGTALVEMADEYGSLGGQDFKLSRKGKGMNDTSYSLIPRPGKAMTKADQALEVIDANKFIKYVPYENQAEFYSGNAQAESNGGGAESWVN